jgi:hypothetical protein
MSRLNETKEDREIRLLKSSQAIKEGQISEMYGKRGIQLQRVRQEVQGCRTIETEEERETRLQQMKNAKKKKLTSETEKKGDPYCKG